MSSNFSQRNTRKPKAKVLLTARTVTKNADQVFEVRCRLIMPISLPKLAALIAMARKNLQRQFSRINAWPVTVQAQQWLNGRRSRIPTPTILPIMAWSLIVIFATMYTRNLKSTAIVVMLIISWSLNPEIPTFPPSSEISECQLRPIHGTETY